MQAYIIRRLIQGLGVLLVMSFVIYGLIGLMPGDPIDMMIQADPNLSTADAARLRAVHGLDRPIVERYGTWLSAALAGDFGYSRQFARPVLDVLLPRLGNTLLLMGVSFVLAIAIALPLGVAAARRPRSLADQAINFLCFAGISVPAFWLALLLIMLFAVTLGVLPAGGMAPAGMQNPGLLDRLPYLVLPVLTLTLASVAGLTRFLRASLIEAMREDYIRTARAKGAGETRVLWRHGLRNALIPVVTVMALDFGTLFSGALITETMFAYAGMGKLIYDAIMNNDYNLALVGLLFATLVTLTANLAADILYARLDPRISYR